MTDEESKVVEIAEGSLAGKIGVVPGSRALAALRFSVTQDDLDPDFRPFIGTDSESDHIPLGPVRARWAPKALQEIDEELRRIEEHYRPFAETACKTLIERFKHG